jgi:hypothetical protein
MRDFRDAKAMAHTLRAALAAKGLKITNSQSLELIAEAFGAADWNTLAAAIRGEGPARANAARPSWWPAESNPVAPFSAAFDRTLHRAFGNANQRKHEYATLEHLLLALIDDADASAVMRACNADIGALREGLVSYLDNELRRLVVGHGKDAKPTVACRRVVQRAGLHAQDLGRPAVTGAHALVAIFAERESPAAWLLGEHDMSPQDAADFIARDGAATRGAAP